MQPPYITAATLKVLDVLFDFAEFGTRHTDTQLEYLTGLPRATLLAVLDRLYTGGSVNRRLGAQRNADDTERREGEYWLSIDGQRHAYHATHQKKAEVCALAEADDYPHLLAFLADHGITEEQLAKGVAAKRPT